MAPDPLRSASVVSLFVTGLQSIFERDLSALQREIEAYPEERELWSAVPGISNSAGTLVLHLAGNLQHFLGAKLGGTEYVRDRKAEFSRRNVPRSALLAEIEAARQAVTAGLARLSDERLTAEYPEDIAGTRLNTLEYLMHLVSHLTYHLGQVDCHRRIVTSSNSAIGAVRPADLGSPRPQESAPR